MVLPQSILLCDAIELAAIENNMVLTLTDLTRLLFAEDDGTARGRRGATDPTELIKEALEHAKERSYAVGAGYPFEVNDRSIKGFHTDSYNTYIFLLLSQSLSFQGPPDCGELIRGFRSVFEDLVCWVLRQCGFSAEVLSIPRGHRGLPVGLIEALIELSSRFGEDAALDTEKITSDDNDLDVDVIAVPFVNNRLRHGWPSFQIQCATGKVGTLEAKIGAGTGNFSSVWKKGFQQNSSVRTLATQHDLLGLSSVHWGRLTNAGWILDRTRLAFLAPKIDAVPLSQPLNLFWERLLTARHQIDWQTGWKAGAA